MNVRLLCLCLLPLLLCPSWAKKQTCFKSASSCDECIQSGPECAWCTALSSNIRCHTVKGLRRGGCPTSNIYNPQGTVQIVKNDSSTEQTDAKTLFLQPQEFSLRLRPGVNQSFPMTIMMPADQRVPDLTMDTSNVPAGVNITFISVTTGNPQLIQVNVEAAECPGKSGGSNQDGAGPYSVNITPRGFLPSLKLEITLECECDCTRTREEHSAVCSGQGALTCGQCECQESYIGQRCDFNLDLSSSTNDDICRSGPRDPVCSGRGQCIGGGCECERRVNPKEKYSGRFCECSNFDCPFHNNKICGGHGRCECGYCVCDDEWTGDDCSCSMETASCLATNGMICNGRGMCNCGTCVCMQPYRGVTCEDCPFCENICDKHRACVECRAFGKGEKKDRCDQDCGHFTVTMVETEAALPEWGENVRFCRTINSDDCIFQYAISKTPVRDYLTVVRTMTCP